MKCNYSKALKVPYLIQKLYKQVSLYKPIRLIAVGLFFLYLLFSVILFSFLIKLFNGLGLVYLIVYLGIPWALMKLTIDIKTDGKFIFRFIYDYIRFLYKFGLRYQKMTLENEPIYLEEVIIFKV